MPTTPKQYRLKKDAPGAEKGLIYRQVTGTDLYTCDSELIIPPVFSKQIVENNPDWFEPIDEEKPPSNQKYKMTKPFWGYEPPEGSLYDENEIVFQVTYPTQQDALSGQINLPDQTLTPKDLPEYFEVVKTEPITPRAQFYVNGATMRKVEEGRRYWYINSGGVVHRDTWLDLETDNQRLKFRNVFLTEEAAEKWAYCLEVQARLEREIARIHEEEGWVRDWSNGTQKKFYLEYFFQEKERQYDYTLWSRDKNIVMSEKARDHMLNKSKVSDNEYFAFLGLVDLVEVKNS